MDVILLQTVPKVGKEGEIVSVKPGYARNYLFARRLAIVATKAQRQVLERREAKRAGEIEKTRSAAETRAEELEGKSVRIQGKAGEQFGKLFGAVTSQDIADALKEQHGVSVEKKVIALIEPIKRLGVHDVELDLHRSVTVTLKVDVYDPEAEVFDERIEVPEEPSEEDTAAEAAAEVEVPDAPDTSTEEPKEESDESDN